MDMDLCQFWSLSLPHSPVDVCGDSQIVVESPSHYDPPVVPVNILVLLDSVVQMSQIYGLLFVQLSPNLQHLR